MTRVALLWHMHQPLYQDLLTGEHILPWVRLHALKDYWGMVALLREFPSVRLTFNLVPSMLVQLEAFARDEARDRHLEIGLKRADLLTEEERAFAIANFFHAHGPRMIAPYPRYAELLAQRDAAGSQLSARSQSSHFSVDDVRDLQVWHKLAWIDPLYVAEDPRVRALIARGRGFTEDDKLVLRAAELELLRRVVPEYRAALERGQIELSTSPFYHPILPLLCDTDVYLRTHPQSRMPREPFRHPEDAAEQLARAVSYHEGLFGQRPIGVWPSEGSVSDAMVPLVARSGFQWMATDEEILARTTGYGFTRTRDGHVEQPERLYRPYRIGPEGADVSCGFRDHRLSDLIGFTYAGWSADGAADDFVQRLVAAGQRFSAATGGAEATVFVILDGENAWEHYEEQGRPFLRALYGRLQAHRSLRTVTMAEGCLPADASAEAGAGDSERLRSVFPGSWINGDFYIWIGHPDDHRAWGQLVDARRALESPPAGLPEESLGRAREEMLIAEGSDWFWWYGDDHSSEHDLEFDELFRRHVRNVYRALDKPIPEDLWVTNITTAPPAANILRPTGFVHPVIDGEITNYFEWVGAGSVEQAAVAGAMHQVAGEAPAIAAVEFGFDLEALYVRVEATLPLSELLTGGYGLTLRFLKPVGLRIGLEPSGGPPVSVLYRKSGAETWTRVEDPRLRSAAGRVAEFEIPFAVLGAATGERVAMFVTMTRGDAEMDRQPRHQAIEFKVPDQRFGSRTWTA
jgi:alpha-amylase/alpha-mannosidase (GH57 family)